MQLNILDIIRINRIKPLGFLALFVLSISNVQAVPITFQFEGKLTSVTAQLSGTFSTGDTFSGTYTFDSAAPVTATHTFGAYEEFDNAVSSMSVSGNGYTAFASNGDITHDFEDENFYSVNFHPVSLLTTGNFLSTGMRVNWVTTPGIITSPDIDAGGPMEYPRFDPNLPPWEIDSLSFYFDANGNVIYDPFQGVVGNPNQPLFTDTGAPAPTNGNNFGLSFSVGGAPVGSISGDFTSVTVVPIPATVWLFGTGLMGLIGFAKRKQICN
jgi:hypothetical protein